MKEKRITAERISAFSDHLRRAERSAGTIENYLRHVRAFAAWLGDRPVTRQAASDWKAHLLSQGYSPNTINAMLGGLNGFFSFAGWKRCRVKALRLQRQLFREDSRELSRSEYDRLVAAAHETGRERLALLMEAICATGHPGQRGALPHCGGGRAGQGGNLPQGQNPHHPHPRQAAA